VTECIHGLELERCDVCSPAVAPARPPAQRVQPPTARRPAARTPSSGTRSAPARRAPAGAPVDVGRQRLHHVTPIANLAAILGSGALIAGAEPPVDVSSPENRAARREADAAGSPVADFVTFSLSPDAYVWRAVRSRTPDPRLAATVPPAADFAVLVTTVAQVGGAESLVVADGDAAAPITRFAAAERAAARMHSLAADPDASLRAEVLVPDRVDVAAVSVVGVAHDRARDAVRTLLKDAGITARVAVHPPWFAPPED